MIQFREARLSTCAAAMLSVLMSSPSVAQQPPPPPAGGSSAGGGVTFSKDPKLLAPLPPPSAEVLKQYPPSPDAHDLAGIWLSEPLPFPSAGDLSRIPYTDQARQRIFRHMQRQQAADAQGKVLITNAGRCLPMDGMEIGRDLFPAEIIQTPDRIVILNEEGRGRWVIHLKGEHPKSMAPSWFGHSVGHWEGDTLVVDTIGLQASEGMFGVGMRSEKARIVSRLRKTDGGRKLELISTTHDPETYTQPFEGRKLVSTWHPELTFLEFQCEENLEGAREGMVE